ncbi:MAG: hypothetical protein WA517_19640 [Candidatus Acidiferrum sp.]
MARGKREMRISLRVFSSRDLVALVTSVLLVTSQFAVAGVNKPPAAEEVAVYKAFMVYFAARTPNAQVSDVTAMLSVPLADHCLHGIKLEKTDAAAKDIHTLPQEIISATDRFKLVTIRPGSRHSEGLVGLLQLSEIGFDARHQYAVLNYDFHCGALCGEGATVVFKKLGGSWKHIRSCGNWMS